MIFKNKKGMTWQQIVLAIIAVIVVVVVVMFFRSGSEKGFNFASDKIDALGDCDDDGVADLYDKCDCDNQIGDSWPKTTEANGKEVDNTKACECDESDKSLCVNKESDKEPTK